MSYPLDDKPFLIKRIYKKIKPLTFASFAPSLPLTSCFLCLFVSFKVGTKASVVEICFKDKKKANRKSNELKVQRYRPKAKKAKVEDICKKEPLLLQQGTKSQKCLLKTLIDYHFLRKKKFSRS